MVRTEFVQMGAKGQGAQREALSVASGQWCEQHCSRGEPAVRQRVSGVDIIPNVAVNPEGPYHVISQCRYW